MSGRCFRESRRRPRAQSKLSSQKQRLKVKMGKWLFSLSCYRKYKRGSSTPQLRQAGVIVSVKLRKRIISNLPGNSDTFFSLFSPGTQGRLENSLVLQKKLVSPQIFSQIATPSLCPPHALILKKKMKGKDGFPAIHKKG